jgi:long-chain acyl-CoA synthetase
LFLSASTKTAIIFRDRQITYNDLFQYIEHYAKKLAATSPKKVAIFSENCPEWIFALYAGWKADAIVVPIDYLATKDEVAYILNDCKPEIVFCCEKTLPLLKEAVAQLSAIPSIYIFEELSKEIPAPRDESFNTLEFPEERTAVIIYTSGTTGSPKGVMLSFENMIANIHPVSKIIPIYTDFRRVLILLPLHHILPLLGSVIAPLYVNSSVAMAPSIKSSDIISTIKDNKVSIIIGVPRLYEAILKGILSKINANPIAKTLLKLSRIMKSPKISRKIFGKVHETLGGNMDYLVCGGAKLDVDMARNYKALGFEMLEGFGMTEAAPMLTFTRPGKWVIGSAGQAMPGVDLMIKDGELIGHGKNIMQGYYNRPVETEEILRNGWLYTGDRGYIDKNGYVYVTGRLKDIIVLSNGKNVNPEEIENKLSAMNPYALEVAIIAKDDQLQCIIYPDYARLQQDGIQNVETTLASELIEVYNKSASPYKRISKIYIAKEELPKTRLGKVKRFQLEALISEKKKKAAKKEPLFEEYIVIRDFLKEASGNDISPDDHFDFYLTLEFSSFP